MTLTKYAVKLAMISPKTNFASQTIKKVSIRSIINVNNPRQNTQYDLWAGEDIIPGDPRLQNRNGKLFQAFLSQNKTLSVVNSLKICKV